MLLSWLAIVSGLIVLVWSADRFIEGASATAKYAGMSPLLIGLVIIGFGTSAPEMVVSAIASSQGNPGLALGNAYGSNITNIGLVVGIVALIAPMQVRSKVLRNELPLLSEITLLSGSDRCTLYNGYWLERPARKDQPVRRRSVVDDLRGLSLVSNKAYCLLGNGTGVTSLWKSRYPIGVMRCPAFQNRP